MEVIIEGLREGLLSQLSCVELDMISMKLSTDTKGLKVNTGLSDEWLCHSRQAKKG